jgi:hypothetical protein
MSVFHLLSFVILIALIYFIYDYYIQTPRYLQEMTRDYNALVDQFHIAVSETAVAYIYIGSKLDRMPVTIQMRSITGMLVETKQSSRNHPELYVPVSDHVRPFCVFGYIRNDRVYIHSMKVQVSFDQETLIGSEKLYIFDKSLDIENDDTNNQVSHPATWVQGDDEIDENQFYQLVVSPAGLFTLVRIESFKTIAGLPTTAPIHRDYKKTLSGIVASV